MNKKLINQLVVIRTNMNNSEHGIRLEMSLQKTNNQEDILKYLSTTARLLTEGFSLIDFKIKGKIKMPNWEPIDRCEFCGSPNINLDMGNESWFCNDCGSGGGGANFWK